MNLILYMGRKIYNYTYYMIDLLKQNSRDKIYIWLSDTTNGNIYIMEGNNIFIYQIMG